MKRKWSTSTKWAAGVSSAVTTTGTGLWIATQDLVLALSMAAIAGTLTSSGLLCSASLYAFCAWLNHRVEMERVRAEAYRIIKTTDAATCGPHDTAADARQKRTDARALSRMTRETTLADTLAITREQSPIGDQAAPTPSDTEGKRLKAVPHNHHKR